jgi:2'-5' RNA ligase
MQQGLVSTSTKINWMEYGFYEYLLVVQPSHAVCSKIIAEQQRFFLEHGVKRVTQAMPHITVAHFLAREGMEPTLIRWVQRICGQQTGFGVTLNNYGGVPPHSVYVRVQDPLPFQQLAKQLKPVDDFIRSSSCPPAKLVGKPHINIAARLPEQVYMKAMADYSAKTFHESFVAQELLLLRRADPLEACKTVNVFRFLPVESSVYSKVA